MTDLDRTTTSRSTRSSYKKSVLLTSQMRSSSPAQDQGSPLSCTTSSAAAGAGVGRPGSSSSCTSSSYPLALPSPVTTSTSSMSRVKAVTTFHQSQSTGSLTMAGIGGGGASGGFPQTYCCILTIPFLGRSPVKTVPVPKARVEMDPPTVKTAKTVMCSYKVHSFDCLLLIMLLSALFLWNVCLNV